MLTTRAQHQAAHTLLSLDWDYYFPVHHTGPCRFLYDWGHDERFPEDIQQQLWMARAAAFHVNALPLPRPSEAWRTFWSQVSPHLSPLASLYVADSHRVGWTPALHDGVDALVTIDAHHDLWPVGRTARQRGRAAIVRGCDNWVHASVSRKQRVTWVRPNVPDAFTLPPWAKSRVTVSESVSETLAALTSPIRRVLIVRSGTWVPPWCDADWRAFVQEGTARMRRVHVYEPRVLEMRPFEMAEVEALVESYRRVATCAVNS